MGGRGSRLCVQMLLLFLLKDVHTGSYKMFYEMYCLIVLECFLRIINK